MSTGIIKRLLKERGFGFIRCDEGRDLFFHCSQLQDVVFDMLSEGQSVQFKVGLNHRGLQAIDIKLIPDQAKRTAENKPIAPFYPRTQVLPWYQSRQHQKSRVAASVG